MVEAKKKTVSKKPTVKKKVETEAILEEKEIKNGNIQEDSQSDDQEVTDREVDKTAKAGKRSAKSLKEAEEKALKEERKTKSASEASDEAEKKTPKVVTRSRTRLERKGKKFRGLAKLIEVGKIYSLTEAMDLAAKTSPVKFDATVELHINLGVDPRQANQNVRGTVVLPGGTGKEVRIAVFAEAADAKLAKEAGAAIAGTDEVLAKLDKNEIDFDILIAPPTLMAQLGKYARVLGPRGLMPNPKSGTVAKDIKTAVTEAKAGRIEYRVDSTGIIHVGIGKVSFGGSKLTANAQALFANLKSNTPTGIKGNFIKAIHVTTSMGPSIKVDLASV